MATREPKEWITVNGTHVPIFEGESKADAVKRAADRQKGAGKKSASPAKGKVPMSEKEMAEKQLEQYDKWIKEGKARLEADSKTGNLSGKEMRDLQDDIRKWEDRAADLRKERDKQTKAQKDIAKNEDLKEKQIAENKRQANNASLKSKINSMYSTYSQQYSADPNKWLQYGDKGKEAYNRYKEAVEQYEPDRHKRQKYFKDRRKF